MLLRAAYQCDTPAKIARNKTRQLVRNEEARFYHYKARNRLLLLSPLSRIDGTGRGSTWRKGLGLGVPVVDAGLFVTLQDGGDGFGDSGGGRGGLLE